VRAFALWCRAARSCFQRRRHGISNRLDLSETLFRRLEALCRETELDSLRDALVGLIVVAVLGDASSVAQRCREELEGEPEHFRPLAAYRRLACGFSYLGEDDTKHAETAVDEAMAIADRIGQRYERVLSLELSAAVCASHDRERSLRQLITADHERER
jgi:hypothetical protein